MTHPMRTETRIAALSETACDVIMTLMLPGETPASCCDRLLSNLAAISYDRANYAHHFGEQTPNLPASSAGIVRLVNEDEIALVYVEPGVALVAGGK